MIYGYARVSTRGQAKDGKADMKILRITLKIPYIESCNITKKKISVSWQNQKKIDNKKVQDMNEIVGNKKAVPRVPL